MYDSNYKNELEHFGIKGMKWGVRRTPAQLGHKEVRPKLTSSDKWKNKELSKIDKLYNKAYKRLDKDFERGVDKKTVDAKRKELERAHKKDQNSIKKMTYGEVEKTRKERSIQDDNDIFKGLTSTALAVGTAAWATQLYGALYVSAAVNILQQAISSPEFQSAAATGYEFLRKFLK